MFIGTMQEDATFCASGLERVNEEWAQHALAQLDRGRAFAGASMATKVPTSLYRGFMYQITLRVCPPVEKKGDT